MPPLSNAEKVRRYRERQKAKKQGEMKQPTPPSDVFRTPFFLAFPVGAQLSSQYAQSLELAGIEPLLFEDDTGPEAATLDDLSDPVEESGHSNPFGDAKGTSLGKAEVVIACLLDAAADLAGEVNAYKKSEIRARIAEIEASELSDTDTKKAALKEAARLNKMLDQLDKQVRWTFPQWRVTG